VGEVPMANVGTNFHWRKCQWPTLELTSSGGSANGQRRNQLLASLKKHFGITQKYFMKKILKEKNEKILIIVIFERYAQTNRQTN
jgi:hypothetical protein